MDDTHVTRVYRSADPATAHQQSVGVALVVVGVGPIAAVQHASGCSSGRVDSGYCGQGLAVGHESGLTLHCLHLETRQLDLSQHVGVLVWGVQILSLLHHSVD